MTRATRQFFSTDPVTLAKKLIGQTLVRVLEDGTRLAGVIVETEAYLGRRDKAAHSYNGHGVNNIDEILAGTDVNDSSSFPFAGILEFYTANTFAGEEEGSLEIFERTSSCAKVGLQVKRISVVAMIKVRMIAKGRIKVQSSMAVRSNCVERLMRC